MHEHQNVWYCKQIDVTATKRAYNETEVLYNHSLKKSKSIENIKERWWASFQKNWRTEKKKVQSIFATWAERQKNYLG